MFQVTGNIVIAMEYSIVFYKFQSCVSDTNKQTYIDFREIPLVVDIEFTSTFLSMTEHCVACGNGEYVIVFKIIDINCMQSDEEISANSLTSDTCNSSAENKKYMSGSIDLDRYQLNDWNMTMMNTQVKIDTEPIRKTSMSEYRPIHIDMECKLRHLSEIESKVRINNNKNHFYYEVCHEHINIYTIFFLVIVSKLLPESDLMLKAGRLMRSVYMYVS